VFVIINKFIDVGMVIIYLTKSGNKLLNIVGFEALFVCIFVLHDACWNASDR
jgi:hypothetical protein